MKVYVTGAKGFAGSYFVSHLQFKQIDVYPSTANILNIDEIKRELEFFQPDYVVHLAASSFVANSDTNKFYTVNIIGTNNLLSAISQTCKNIQKVILTSSAAVYGNLNAGLINELAYPSPTNDYGVSKYAMECSAKLWCTKLPIVITRPFNFTGVGQSVNFVIPKIVDHFLLNKHSIKLGNVNVYREFGDVRDFVDIYFSLILSGLPGQIYNICTGVLYSLNDIVDICCSITGKEIEIELDEKLVREGEIQKLGGDPSLLFSTLNSRNKFSVKDTLVWMLHR